jgi:hypothetical protein
MSIKALMEEMVAATSQWAPETCPRLHHWATAIPLG